MRDLNWKNGKQWNILSVIFPVLVVFVSIVGAWYLTGYRIEINENKVSILEARSEQYGLKINTLETKVDYIVEGITDIRKKLDKRG
ncbi:MAG: hypothetical protein M0Q46_06160 [Endomicrobiales bacterium]|nr:hypothetical protein [Endomicrobiales bacterium]